MIVVKLRALLAGAAVVTLAACGEASDERTDQLVTGMSRDSAIAMLSGAGASADSAAADSLKNIWRRTQYLVDGQSIEVLWYSSVGERWSPSDTIPEGQIIPVVLLDGKVAGIGRNAYNRVAERFKLPPNRY